MKEKPLKVTLRAGGKTLTIVGKPGRKGDPGKPGPVVSASSIAAALKRDTSFLASVKGEPGEPGKDAESEVIVREEGLSAEEIRNRLESLTGGSRLSVRAIKGVEELIVSYINAAGSSVGAAATDNVGATAFLQLSDVPGSYAGQAGKALRVNATNTGLEFYIPSGSSAWGSISGTLADQTDLQAALDDKVAFTDLTVQVPAYETDPFYSANTYAVGMDQDVNSGASVTFAQVSITGQLAAINGQPLSWPGSTSAGVLTNDGSGNLSWAAVGTSIGASVGSGTEGSVLFLGPSGVLAQDNQNFYYENSQDFAMVHSTLGSEKITNTGFSSGSSWTATSGWSIASGVATHGSNGTGALTQALASMVTPLAIGETYVLTYTVSGWTVGTVTPSCGGATLTARGADGTYSERFVATTLGILSFTPTNTARFAIDNVSLKRLSGGVLASGTHYANLVNISKTSLGVTTADGLVLDNTTDATGSVLQVSPAFRLRGRGWSGSASIPVDFRQIVLGATSSNAIWKLEGSINGAAYKTVLSYDYVNGGKGFMVEATASQANGSPGTTRMATFENIGSYSWVDFNFSGVTKVSLGASSSGEYHVYAPSSNGLVVHAGGSTITGTTATHYLGSFGIYIQGVGGFTGNVSAGYALTNPTNTLQHRGSFGAHYTIVTAGNVTLDASHHHVYCDTTNASACTGTPSTTTCSTYTASGQATCESHLPCVWFGGNPCSAFDNESGMGTCLGTTGCSASSSSCAGPSDQSSCESQDDSYGGDCAWTLGSNTCPAFTNTGDCNAASPCYANMGGDCSLLSDGGGDGTLCATQPECSYDSGSGACSGSFFTSCDGDNATYSCTGNYYTGSCTGTYGAACSGTVSCGSYTSSGPCAAETGCTWGSQQTVNLPSLSAHVSAEIGREYLIKKIAGSGSVVIHPFSGDNIDGSTSDITISTTNGYIRIHGCLVTADCSTLSEGACPGETGCTASYPACSWNSGDMTCSGHASCTGIGDQGTCEGTTYYSGCSGTYTSSKRWNKTGQS